jgi:hypothetical protein
MQILRALLLTLVATILCGLGVSWLLAAARHAGIAVPEGLVRGVIFALGFGFGQYFIRLPNKSRLRKS